MSLLTAVNLRRVFNDLNSTSLERHLESSILLRLGRERIKPSNATAGFV